MFDLSDIQFTFETYIGCQIAFFVIVALFWNRYVTNYDYSNNTSYIFIIVVILFSVYGFENGDFYGYQRYLKYREEMDAMELIYTNIADIVSYNYFLFRLVVWGTATCLVNKAAQNFGLQGDKTLFCLFFLFVSTFDYARASLAMSVYFLGISYLCNNVDSIKSDYLKGLIFVLISYFFHHSMIVCIILTPVIYIRLNKKRILLVLTLILMSGTLLSTLFKTAFGGGVFDNAELNEKLSNYSDIENGVASTYEWMRRIWEYFIFLLPLCYFTKYAYSSESEFFVSDSVKKLFVLSFAVITFAISTIVGDSGSFVFFYRYLYMSIIPISIIVCYLRTNEILSHNLFTKLILFCCLYRSFSVIKLILGGNMF